MNSKTNANEKADTVSVSMVWTIVGVIALLVWAADALFGIWEVNPLAGFLAIFCLAVSDILKAIQNLER